MLNKNYEKINKSVPGVLMLSCSLLLLTVTAVGQNLNNVQYPEMVKVSARREITIPDISGFYTLKCDFHIHTVFSDGIVWPTYRVDEAWEEGLDAIAITDHIENQPSKKYVTGDHNASFEIASEEAKGKNIILIRAGEVTREMPPGHLNALFLNDVNKLDVPDPVRALLEAKKQGAFIIWNHPGWKAQQPDSCIWMPLHQKLLDKGLINGIEVFNELEFYPVVLDWCLKKKLAVISNSDIHDIVGKVYDLNKSHRPMTLVFVRERNMLSIREALFEQRTIAYFDNKLAGRQELLEAIFRASVSIKPAFPANKAKNEIFEIRNISSIPFNIETLAGESFVIPAKATLLMKLDRNVCHEVIVTNLYTGALSNLKVILNY